MAVKRILLFILITLTGLSSYSFEVYGHRDPRQQPIQNPGSQPQPGHGFKRKENIPQDDLEFVRAVNDRRNLNYIEGSNVTVIKVLPDDNSGLTHQKWMVQLSSGETMMAVYNTDMCERVPLKVGDTLAMGGQFIWTRDGGLLHWLHHDPRGSRPDGFVELNDKFYCLE